MTRGAPAVLMAAALRVHHDHVHGSSIGYAGIAAAAAAGWVGVPGLGEATLIAAGVLAAAHKLDIAAVVTVAWLGATLGGVVGWLIGLKGGRALVTAPGPLRRVRYQVLSAGEAFFERFGVIAVFFAPSWVAGINRMRAARYLVLNAISAILWALMVGLGAFLLGPTVEDLVAKLGLVGGLILAALIVVTAFGEGRRRLRRRRSGAIP